MSVVITPERPDAPDAVELVHELEAHLASRYPVESRRGFSVERLVAEGVRFFVLRVDGRPAGCGGILLVDAVEGGESAYGEVKRMYVRPRDRGLGLGERILGRLADEARAQGITVLRLETGVHQLAAIALYERVGFRRIPPFGPYTDDPLSRCYELRLDAGAPTAGLSSAPAAPRRPRRPAVAVMPGLDYPAPPIGDQVDDYHGMSIADPYRPLEDSDTAASRAWIAAENALTERVLDAVPGRRAIRDRLAALWNIPRAGAPWRRGDRWFQLRNTGLQDQDVLWTADGPEQDGRELLDPNGLGDAGIVALTAIAVSESGALVACATSDAGSDWRTWQVRRVATGEDLPDRVPWAKFAPAAWTHDDAGFFYGRYPEPPAGAAFDAPNRDMELRYHRLGTAAADDHLVFATPDEPEWIFDAFEVSEDGRLLVVTVAHGTDPKNRVYVADLADGVEAATVRPLLGAADAHYEPLAVLDTTLYLLTDRDAPLGRVVAVDVDDPEHVREVIPEAVDTLERVHVVGNRLAVVYLHHAHHRLALHELDGTHVADVALPGIGTIVDMAGRRTDDELFLTFMTFAEPASLLAVAASDGTVRAAHRPVLAWDPADFVTEQVFVASDDGTRVPIFLARRRDAARDGEVPTLLYGYGGFQIPVGPTFKPEWLAWMERGGLLAVASLRGGGEYGTAWHDAGRRDNKQNVFDDFAACARWLASSGWTRAERIGISGRSNGGLLVGASLTQHPELFGAAVAEVGVMDMLRFEQFTIGRAWASDYGSASDPEEFRTLLAYSPLHNIRPETAYPATLVTTGDHDDRVVPGHSFKFAAALQAAQAGTAPILVRIDTDAGHGVGKPVSKLIDERADVLAFLELALGPR